MKGGSPRVLSAGFALALVLLGGVGWLNVHQAAIAQETGRMVAQSERMRYQLTELLSAMQDAETGGRGYALTGMPDFLAPYENALQEGQTIVRHLRQLAADNPEQLRMLDRLEPLITRRFELSAAVVRLRRDAGLAAAQAEVAGGRGKAAMDVVRAEIVRMTALEGGLLAARITNVRREADLARTLMVGGTALSIGLFVTVFLLLLRVNRERRQSEAELDRFFSLSLDLLCIAGSDGYFKRLSPAFTATLGWSVAEILARPFLDFVHPDDRAATLREIERQVSAAESVLNFENRYQHKNGSWRVLSWKSTPQPGGLMFATARDVTERKQAEEKIVALNAELLQRARQLAEANQELAAFSYSVSHDLRSPLRGIDGFSQVLEEDYGDKLDDAGRGYLARVRAAAQRMSALIDDLLKLSKITRAELHRQPVDLSALARTAAAELHRREPQRQVQWAIADGLAAEGDPALLRVALDNLFDNAWKFSGQRPETRIEFTATANGQGRAFFVRDNGAGFDMAHAKKLFGAFQRLHTLAEFEGTGIGLATVQRIIHRHGGRVWAEGAVGSGATFYFTLATKDPNHEN